MSPHLTPTPDLFDAETRVLSAARATFDDPAAGLPEHREALGELLAGYERLLRETRRLIRRSDREELEMNRLNQRLHELAGELEYRATHDSLTGVLNRAAVIEHARTLLGTSGMALVVLDIDHFKRINDSFGHPTGDQVIRGVVACLQPLVPSSARIGRVGGEEFTVLLPGRSIDVAETLAEQMRAAIAAHDFHLPDHSAVTASFGVGALAKGSSFDVAYRCADEALYAAKRGGRNRVMCADHVHG